MALGKRFAAAVVALFASLALSASACGAGPDAGEQALRLLIRALDRTSVKNIVAIMQLSDGGQAHESGPITLQVVKVVIAKDGRQKLTVLEPLQQSGLVIVEAGGTRQIYNPDTKTLTTVPTDDFFDPGLRRRLITANYRLSMKTNIQVAGLDAVRITAVSKKVPGQSTDVFVDPVSKFVLKVVAHESSGHSTVRYETRSVSFPESLPPDAFTIAAPQGATTKPADTPVPVASLAEAKRRAGFAPVKPGRLPFGFIVHTTYVKRGPDYRLIGFELTDGLARAVVFEFPAKNLPASLKAEMKSPQGEFIRRGAVYIGIFCDLAPKVRKGLLAAYGR